MNFADRPFIIPIFMPHAACPHQCVFCNQKAVSPASMPLPSSEDVNDRIHLFLSYRKPERKQVQIAFYGGTFLGLSKEKATGFLKLGQKWVEQKKATGLRLSTRPDTIDETRLSWIAPFSVQTVELGVQSMDDGVLERIERGHGAKETITAVKMLKAGGYEVGLQLMVGLPGETEKSVANTANAVAALEPDFVRIHPTLVLTGSPLAEWLSSGRYVPLSLEEAVKRVKFVYAEMAKAGIPVVRMGLHPDERLAEPGTVLAGPFHPAFGELVLSAVFREAAVKQIIRVLPGQKQKPAGITLWVHPRKISAAMGPKKAGLRRLQNRFPEICLQIRPDARVPDSHGAVRVEIMG